MEYGVGAGKYGIDFIDFNGDEMVLDVGSGTGRDVAVISQRLNKGGQIFAIDISKPLLNLACQRTSNSITKPVCSVASVEELLFDDEQFDVVIAKHVLNHVSDIDRGLSEITRELKRNGIVVVTTGVKTSRTDLVRVSHREAIQQSHVIKDVRLSRTSFNCENARQYLEQFFAKIAYHFYGFQMVFPDVDSFMLYYTTLPCFQEATDDVATKVDLANHMRNIIGQLEMPIVLDRSRGTFICTKH